MPCGRMISLGTMCGKTSSGVLPEARKVHRSSGQECYAAQEVCHYRINQCHKLCSGRNKKSSIKWCRYVAVVPWLSKVMNVIPTLTPLSRQSRIRRGWRLGQQPIELRCWSWGWNAPRSRPMFAGYCSGYSHCDPNLVGPWAPQRRSEAPSQMKPRQPTCK